jgi:hypothetical protein
MSHDVGMNAFGNRSATTDLRPGAPPPAGPSAGARASVTVSPAARRATRSTWRDPRLVIGLVIVAVSVLLGARLFAAADDTVQVSVARVDLPAGAQVRPGDLDTRDIRFGDQELADRYLPAGATLPAGAVLTRDVAAGEMVPRAAVGQQSAAVTEVPLSVAADAVPRGAHAGSVVDVWVTPRPDARAEAGGEAESVLVFDDVVVVDAPRSGSALGPSATRQVVVGVPDEQRDQLSTALARLATGTVVLTERG